ncbi:phytanoyl-CoA dioxygenase [Aulographum hederae CBS 113979]|uniref:Phytanoyl-CoA dioxygenase n=1 Tax=Aulographum hederae CBS 113979 TaxID=1176131 RepID=A0A6G1GLX3_9PEZI|nr:phytanoyl-CoA dioxygenase [Aulographum hederae CBS 113979]
MASPPAPAPAPPPPSSPSPTPLRTSISHHGYILLPSLLPPSTLSTLRAASASTTSLARSGHWPHIRALPKQFPPWPLSTPSSPPRGIWGVQHLLHPSLPSSPVFADSYFNPAIIDVVKQILSCEEDELVMELYNLLVRPDEDFELRWHRDDIPPSATAEEEEERLARPSWHAQWNLALYDDSSLIVVPGSHRRARTEVERLADPYEADLPGQVVVEMKAGDVVFYDNNILHRGFYRGGTERMTLHGSMGHVGGSRERARNVLQHGVGEWVDGVDFGGIEEPEMRELAEGMRRRLVEMGRGRGCTEYSQRED